VKVIDIVYADSSVFADLTKAVINIDLAVVSFESSLALAVE